MSVGVRVPSSAASRSASDSDLISSVSFAPVVPPLSESSVLSDNARTDVGDDLEDMCIDPPTAPVASFALDSTTAALIAPAANLTVKEFAASSLGVGRCPLGAESALERIDLVSVADGSESDHLDPTAALSDSVSAGPQRTAEIELSLGSIELSSAAGIKPRGRTEDVRELPGGDSTVAGLHCVTGGTKRCSEVKDADGVVKPVTTFDPKNSPASVSCLSDLQLAQLAESPAVTDVGTQSVISRDTDVLQVPAQLSVAWDSQSTIIDRSQPASPIRSKLTEIDKEREDEEKGDNE